jgi:hypothetical protein
VATEYLILITDRTLQYVGDPIVTWESLDVTLRFNEPSSGVFVAPAHQWTVDQMADGNRVVVIRRPDPEDGYLSSVLIAGPIEEWQIERADDGENAEPGKLTVNFADDLAQVVARQTYPDPTQSPAGQTTDRWQYTGNAETALRTLVDANAGPGALVSRRIPMLTLGAAAGVGSAVTVNADRMQPIGDLMRQVADTGGGLGFRTRQSAGQILFEAYAPPDKTGTIRFGFSRGNLKYLSVKRSAPKATTAIVGGQGEGADRALIEVVNSDDETAWGRYETLVSRPGTNDPQSLQDDGNKTLGDAAATTQVTSNVADTPEQKFGRDYQLGDQVAIETGPGRQYTDRIVTVHIQAFNSAGEVVTPFVGSQAAKPTPAWVTRLREIEGRLAKVERTVKPAAVP